MFAPTFQQLSEVEQNAAATSAAIACLLIKKGVFTAEEFEQELAASCSRIDQLAAQQREEQLHEFDKQHPSVRKLLENLTGGDT